MIARIVIAASLAAVVALPALAQQPDTAGQAAAPAERTSPPLVLQDSAAAPRAMEPVSLPQRAVGLLGMVMLLGVGYALSRKGDHRASAERVQAFRLVDPAHQRQNPDYQKLRTNPPPFFFCLII